jgi:hypothetical protein
MQATKSERGYTNAPAINKIRDLPELMMLTSCPLLLKLNAKLNQETIKVRSTKLSPPYYLSFKKLAPRRKRTRDMNANRTILFAAAVLGCS